MMHVLLRNDGVASVEGTQEGEHRDQYTEKQTTFDKEERQENSAGERMTGITYKRVTSHKKDVEGEDPGNMLRKRLSLSVGHT